MFALLLTTFAGLGAAEPLVPRGNNNCAAASRKCAQAYQLNAASTYCSSALKFTVTKTSTICKETTTYSKKYTSTCTVKGGATVTSTVTECLRPTQAAVDVPVNEKRGGEEIEEKRSAAQKPNCLPYEKASVTEACKCLNVKPQTTTVVSKTTTTKTYTVTVKAKTTITEPTDPNATPTTTYVYRPTPPAQFYVANEDDRLLGTPDGIQKRSQSGLDNPSPDKFGNVLLWDNEDILWRLNNANNLVIEVAGADGSYTGKLAAELTGPAPAPGTSNGDDIQVAAASRAEIASGDYKPITCSVSVSRNNDGLCPLTCSARRGDVNQGPDDRYWFLGPRGSLSPVNFGTDALNTYKTFVVTNNAGRGRGVGNSKRNFGRRGEKYAGRRG